MTPTELEIRNAIVAVVAGVTNPPITYNRLRRPKDGLLSQFNALNVNDASKINVCYVRRVTFTEEVSGFDDPISSLESYLLYFYRGIEDDDGNGSDSENDLQLLIENVRAAFKLDANRHLGFDGGISQGGMATEAPFVDCQDFNYDCHRFVGRLVVTVAEC